MVTDSGELPEEKVSWDDLSSEAVIDQFDEMLGPTDYVPASRRIRR